MSKTGGRQRKLKHPLFLECAELEPHHFWKEQFQNYAYGKFPNGISYANNQMVVKRRKRRQQKVYQISSNPNMAIQEIKNVLRQTNGLISRNELIKRKIRIRELLQAITLPEESTWSDIKAPTQQALIISIFVESERVRNNLTESEADNLFVVITTGLILGTIAPGDIEMKKGEIIKIHGLKHTVNGYFTTRKTPSISQAVPKPPKNTQRLLGDDFRKYNQVHQSRVHSATL